MTQREMFSTGLNLMAVCIFAEAAIRILDATNFCFAFHYKFLVENFHSANHLISEFSYPAGLLVVTGIIWSSAKIINRKVNGGDPSSFKPQDSTAQSITTVGKAAIGVSTLLRTINDLFAMIQIFYQGDPEFRRWDIIIRLSGIVMEVAFSLWLIFGGEVMVRWITSLRFARKSKAIGSAVRVETVQPREDRL